MNCSDIQEQLAWGKSLSPEQREHTATCAHCLKIATNYSLLDETLGAMTSDVPAAFAERVMVQVRLEAQRSALGWLGERWIQIALVYGGALVAVLNVLRFLAGILVPAKAPR